MWFRRWFGLPLGPEGFGEGCREVNGDICGDVILKEKWGRLEVNAVNWR